MMFLPYNADSIAEVILANLEEVAAARGRASLAIPGGRSPGPVLGSLAGMISPYLRARLHLFWVDERAVPRGHADRNDAPTLAAWEAGGPLPGHVHPMPAEAADLDAAAAAYAATLMQVTRGSGSIDVCLLGIGEDGHIASLFPEHPGLRELEPVFAITDSPKPPPRRISLSLGVLSRSGLNVVLALGAAKGAIARQVRDHAANPAIPVSLLPAERSTWYLDPAASAALA